MTVTFYDANGEKLRTYTLDAVPRQGDDAAYNGTPCRVLCVGWTVDFQDVRANVHLNKTLDTLTS